MKVAVVGGGISGLTAVWLLNEHSDHEVHLFEANDYVGGHTNTRPFKASSGPACPVDTGFIVFNKITYPNFLNFLKVLKIDYIPSNMSFSVKRAFGPAYEWSGNGIRSLFVGVTSWSDWFSQYRLLWDLVRFNWLALDVLSGPDRDLTIAQYLSEHGYAQAFSRNYLLPMIASIWSTPADKTALLFPMRTLIRFMCNHHLLQILDQPQWLTIKNGSKTYVDRILSKLDPARCFTSTPIESISIDGSGKIHLNVDPIASHGPFDQVIFASHADQTTSILKKSECQGLFDEEIRTLSRFEFNQNKAVLHNDVSLMPRRREVWTSWNYLITHPPEKNVPETPQSKTNTKHLKLSNRSTVEQTVSLTYWMNLLQSIPEETHGPVLVTLNPPGPINPKYVFGEWSYDHPLYTTESVKAQKQIRDLQAKKNLSFIGAWTNYGFHEDGLTSALNLLVVDKAELFGVRAPFEVCLRDEKVETAGWTVRVLLASIQFIIEVLVWGWTWCECRWSESRDRWKVE